ncbi:putative amidoligase domain-containing protein [Paenibacillus massiliensis]|uniref:putative amidoligase domain-containing protein n=1 Tax=Paenibacillus massiliensis TaxID=225917 RepID=UPI0003628B7F|nr:hypothetical protein [Paenibacillus massiliensis]
MVKTLGDPSLYAGLSEQQKLARLLRSGIRANWEPSRTKGFALGYAVQIRELELLEVSRRGTAARMRIMAVEGQDESISSVLMKKLERAAVRTLYTLGLDSGEVILMPAMDAGYEVRSVREAPWMEDSRLQRMYQSRESAHAQEKAERDIAGYGRALVGMDPEFILVRRDQGKVVPASRFLERWGEAGCDAVTRRERTLFPIAELRPAPSSEPERLLRHLRKALAAASSRITDRSLLWRAGAMPQPGLPLGGHLHFSRVRLEAEVLRALDNYLALPIATLEDPKSTARRPRYGILGDFRRKEHGGFEYRTLPSFLISPLLAKGVIGAAYLIAEHYRELHLRPLDQEEIHAAFYAADRDRLYTCLEPLLQGMEKVVDYERYEPFTGPLFRELRSGGHWDEMRDIRPLWRLPT